MQKDYKVQEGQTLFDIAIHSFGSIEAALEIARCTDLGLTEKLPAGRIISLPKPQIEQIDHYVLATMIDRNIVPATGSYILDEINGIGDATIGADFRIG